MDVIVRFNVPNGFAPGTDERLTVWAVRHAAAATRRGYWGLEQLEDAVSERLIRNAEVRACLAGLARTDALHPDAAEFSQRMLMCLCITVTGEHSAHVHAREQVCITLS